MKRTLTALSIAAALALTGCSGSTEAADAPSSAAATAEAATVAPVATEAPASSVAGDPAKGSAYQLVSMGNATVLFDLPTDIADPRLAEIESFRQDAGAAPVSYIIADVDNRDGLEPVNMYKISAYDTAGKEYEFTSVAEAITEWGPTYSEDYIYTLPDGTKLDEATGVALSDRKTALHNANIGNVDVSEKGVMILVSKTADLPATFERVGVQPSGAGEQQNALPVSQLGKD